MRKLVTIRKVSAIKPIDGADLIELAIVDGWQCVVKKSQFKVNDFCVYFEIDSFLPIKEQYEFLRKSSFRKDAMGTEGFRLRTIKLRKQLSQGLILPISDIIEEIKLILNPKFTGTDNEIQYLMDNDNDLAEWLGVIKYEAPQSANMGGNAKGNFPSFIPKTDQERIQNIWKQFKDQYNDVEFEVTLKLDGTSATYFYNDGKLGVCSRNLELKFDEETDLVDKGNTVKRNRDTYVSVGVRQNIFQSLKNLGKNLAIQGEIIGEGIQGNKDKCTGQCLFIYDVYDIDQRRYLTADERVRLLESMEELDTAENFRGDLTDHHIIIHELHVKLSRFETIEDLLKYADGKSINSDIREGLVFKSMDLVDGRVISFKVISNEFLLKYED